MIPDDTEQPPTKKAKGSHTALTFSCLKERIILLSCFDGIGRAALILNDLGDGIGLHISWEIDPDWQS